MSILSREGSFFLVQPGLVAWDDMKPIPGFPGMTVSVCGPRLHLLLPALLAVVSRWLWDGLRVLRVHVASVPVGIGGIAATRLIGQLRRDPPGFGRTRVREEADRVVVSSELVDADRLELDFISSYRTTLLLVLPAGGDVPEISGFDNAELRTLLERGAAALLCAFDHDTHGVFQIMSGNELASVAAEVCRSLGIHEVVDPSIVAFRISSFRS